MVASAPQTEIFNSCDMIIKTVRSTRLNYGITETPHSIYVSVRKSLDKTKISQQSSESTQNEQISEAPYFFPTTERDKLRAENDSLKQFYEQAVLELEGKNESIKLLEDKVERLHHKLDQCKAGETKVVDSITEEKRQIQVKHEKVCAEGKLMKNEIVELKKSYNAETVALRSAKKEIKELTYKYEKKIEAMNDKIQELSEFRNRKLAEEKDLKSKITKADKKLKSVLEREAKIKLKKSNNSVGTATEDDIEDEQNNFISAPLKPINVTQVSLTSLDPNSITSDSINMDQVSCTMDSSNKDQASDTSDSSKMDRGFFTLDSTDMNQNQSQNNIDPTSSDSDNQEENILEKADLLEAFFERFEKKVDDFLNSSWSTAVFWLGLSQPVSIQKFLLLDSWWELYFCDLLILWWFTYLYFAPLLASHSHGDGGDLLVLD